LLSRLEPLRLASEDSASVRAVYDAMSGARPIRRENDALFIAQLRFHY
jgi:hypothetical protein